MLDETKAKILALYNEGTSVGGGGGIAEQLSVPVSTVYYALAHMEEADAELSRKVRQHRIGRKAAALLEAKLDQVAEDIDSISIQQAGIIYGITTDKVQAQEKIDQAKQAHDEDVEDRRRIAATADALTQALSEGRATIVDGRILAIDGVATEREVAQRPSQLSAAANADDHADDQR